MCKNSSHNTEKCRKNKKKTRNKNDATKSVRDNYVSNNDIHEGHSYAFNVNVDITSADYVNHVFVDCGATTHIVHDMSKFIRFDTNFRNGMTS